RALARQEHSSLLGDWTGNPYDRLSGGPARMRLGPFDPNNIRVRRGEGGGMGLPIGGGSIGCGTIVIALIAYFVFGADPMQFLGGGQVSDQGYSRQAGQPGESAAQICSENQYATEACN